MADLLIDQDTNIPDPTRTVNPIDSLIQDYTMGAPTQTEQIQNKESFQPEDYKVPGAGFREAGKKVQQMGNIAKEKEQNDKLYKLHQAFNSETTQILNDTANGKIDYNDAVLKLSSLQIKASNAGLKTASDTIAAAQNNVLKLSGIKEKQDARLAKRYANSTPVGKAKEQIDALNAELGSNASSMDLITWDPDKKWVDNDQLDTNIATARVLAYMQKEGSKGVGSKSKDEIEKMPQNILNIKTKIANRPKTQGLSDKKAQAALDIQELVSAGATIEDAYMASVKNKTEWFGYGDTVPTWPLEDVLTPDQMKLAKENETSWQPVRDWLAGKKQSKGGVAISKPGISNPTTKSPTWPEWKAKYGAKAAEEARKQGVKFKK